MIDNIKESVKQNLNELAKNIQHTSVENASKLFAISQRFLSDSNLLNDSLVIKWLERNKRPKSFQRKEECTLIHRYIVMPMDLNPNGTLFGGKMLELLDTAGSMYIMNTFNTQSFVTVEMQNVFFLSSPKLGDLLNFYVETIERKKASVWIRLVAVNETVGGESKRVIDSEIRFAFMDKIKR
jgi:acyl-CoA hydrolase